MSLLITYIDENKQLNITKEELKQYTKNNRCEEIKQLIQDDLLEFPYKKFFEFKKTNLIECFNLLKKYNPQMDYLKYIPSTVHAKIDIKFDKKYTRIIHKPNEYYLFDNLADYFTEPVRVKCNVINQKSIYDIWHDTADILFTKLNDKFINAKSIREYLYKNYYECNTFRPQIVVSLIKTLYNDDFISNNSISNNSISNNSISNNSISNNSISNNSISNNFISNNSISNNFISNNSISMIDISAGWGDRLVGALASGVKVYHAFDPNTELKKYHDEIIKTFKTPDQEAMIYYEPFETNILVGKYDICISSPPFFDYEIYGHNENQSVIKYNTKESGMKNFMLKSIKRVYDLLKQGGFMCLYISDIKGFNIIEQIYEYCKEINFEYKGIISSKSSTSEKSRPILIWKK